MPERSHVEEIHLRKGDIDLRLLINHSHGHLRFMDFRVGNYPEKREALDEIARRYQLRKAFTLVEKQDSQNWRSVGFSREGIYPTFFRTADAYTMSRLYDAEGDPLPPVAPIRPSSEERTAFPGRRLRKPEGLRIAPIAVESGRRSLVAGMNGRLRALPFGRIAAPDLVFHARARRLERWVCAEINDSFGHATLGFAPPPADEADLVLSAYAGNSLVTALLDQGVNNVYGLSPINDRWSNELFAGLGFKVSGRLADHLRTSDGYVTTLIWHRRLAAVREPTLPA